MCSLMHQLLVDPIQLIVVVKLNLNLAGLGLCLGAHCDACAQVAFEFFQRGTSIWIVFGKRLFRSGSNARFPHDETLELANCEPTTRDAMRKFLAFFRVRYSDQSARVAGAELTFF